MIVQQHWSILLCSQEDILRAGSVNHFSKTYVISVTLHKTGIHEKIRSEYFNDVFDQKKDAPRTGVTEV